MTDLINAFVLAMAAGAAWIVAVSVFAAAVAFAAVKTGQAWYARRRTRARKAARLAAVMQHPPRTAEEQQEIDDLEAALELPSPHTPGRDGGTT